MLRRVRADLHVHTCLSPCGDLEMSPIKIIRRARDREIEILAICDHNSSENAPAVMRAAEGRGPVVLPGMEVCSKEEVHVLALFGRLDDAQAMQSIVYRHLSGRNDPAAFGLQVISNERDEVLGFQDRLLIGALDLDLGEIVQDIHRLGGVVVASHIDRESFSVISQLGFIPASVTFDALELSGNISPAEARERFASYARHTFLRNSDAHFLEDLGKNTSAYLLEQPTFEELCKALRTEDGRMVCTE